MTPLSFKWLLVDFLIFWCSWRANADKFTLGYLTGASRRPWDKEYSRPGLSISGERLIYSDILVCQIASILSILE